jgi:hypothetical protein
VQSTALIVVGGRFDPDEVSRGLTLKPWRTWRIGERKSSNLPDGTVLHFRSRHRSSGWKRLVDGRLRRSSLESQLDYWLTVLEPRRRFLRSLRRRRIEVVLDCFLDSDVTLEVHLPAALLTRLGALDVQLDVTWSVS